MLLENALQAEAFFVAGDFAGDAVVIDGRHVDAVAAGEGDVAGDAGALLGDGLFGDLDQDLLAGLEQVGNRRERGTFGTVAVAEGGTGATVTTAVSAAITTTVATITAVSAAITAFTAFATIPVPIAIPFRAGFGGTLFDGSGFNDTFGGQGRRGASGGGDGGTIAGAGVLTVIATATAAAATAATLEAGATIALAESGRQAMGLAGGFGATIGTLFAFGTFAVFAFVTLFPVAGIGGGKGLTVFGGNEFFGGALGSVGFVFFVLVDFGQKLFASFVDGVDVFQFCRVDVVGDLGEGVIDIFGDGVGDGRFGDNHGRGLGHRRRLNDRDWLGNFRFGGDHDGGNGLGGGLGLGFGLRFRLGLRFNDGGDFGFRLNCGRRRGRRRGGNCRAAVLGQRFAGEQEDGLRRFRAQEFGNAGRDERRIGPGGGSG